VQAYRRLFRPSRFLDQPYVMLGVNVFAADTDAQARLLATSLQQAFVNLRSGRPGQLPPPLENYAAGLAPRERAIIEEALACTVVGAPETVRQGLEEFAARTGADELMLTAQVYDHQARLRSYEIAAEACGHHRHIPAGDPRPL
jgi:alkanesulfonate monooxygenase SsuD/methylene tetrahydromethanopterin reductase-like flavin-dependent oxidoreductase (luciferase family)